ncbi:hypothetical protein M0R45_023357 [Rubus argutus]|uniref:Uncharacterized protein n=1 Tax=Rubus argutus TaxID=59490 RepID=A0AAW1WNE7_RUBAR
MDLWVVAAAAGAGYLTKYWQKLSRDRDNLLHFSFGDANLEKSESPSRPFHRHEDRKPVSGERLSDINLWGSVSATEVASTSGYDGEKLGSNILSLSNISPVYPENENENGDVSRHGNDLNGNTGALLPKSSNGEMGTSHIPLRNKSSFRTEYSYRHIVKPLNSLESCLMAQLYKERAETCVLTLPSPSTPSMRPLIVSDGSRIISRANGDHFSAQIGIEKMKIETGKGQTGRCSSSSHMASGKHLHFEGSPHGVVLFCLGISIGVISSIIANKEEVDKLKDVLKQTESLVDDLQEELEMKDSATVKELANENYGSQDTSDNSVFNRALNPFSPKQNMDKYDGRDSYEQKAEESSESMSKIEAELEAELERLELNMNTSTLEGRLTDLDELDPDFRADFAQGELRAEMVGGHTAQPKSNENASSTTTAHHCGNYAVSPRELSVRLHEVIQSRLEERIQELEAALQSSQREVRVVELEHKESLSDISNSYVQSTIEEMSRKRRIHPCQVFETFRDQMPSQSYGVNGSIGHSALEEEKWLGDEHISRFECSNNSSVSEEENSDSDEEMEKQLIKQIVEKTKKGSPVVLNAQKWLFSMNENES